MKTRLQLLSGMSKVQPEISDEMLCTQVKHQSRIARGAASGRRQGGSTGFYSERSAAAELIRSVLRSEAADVCREITLFNTVDAVWGSVHESVFCKRYVLAHGIEKKNKLSNYEARLPRSEKQEKKSGGLICTGPAWGLGGQSSQYETKRLWEDTPQGIVNKTGIGRKPKSTRTENVIEKETGTRRSNGTEIEIENRPKSKTRLKEGSVNRKDEGIHSRSTHMKPKAGIAPQKRSGRTIGISNRYSPKALPPSAPDRIRANGIT
ncbi:hypothetical protein EVAR_39888_1 [Eumeta japonica]|uniref:Uncharacterized protein n=1 Tax=Eumeta variegata TaxID=151549 RepID=A0A4C1WQ21_EUMVA|nr:hypothetical protein EVAR_39888_1 [Eumeta japonica]